MKRTETTKRGLMTRSRPAARGAWRQFRSAFSRAFTLVELMVVLMLVGILTAMIIPEMHGTYEDALLRSSARKLVNVCNLAYSRAVTIGQMHQVRFDSSSGRYQIEQPVREGKGTGSFLPIERALGGQGEVDTRIAVEVHPAGEEVADSPSQHAIVSNEQRSDNPQNLIRFYPDGTSDPCEILLRDRDGFRLALRLNPITARVRIFELERERAP